MGVEITKSEFTEAEYVRFSKKLQDNLSAMQGLLSRKGFGEGPASIGAEFEMYLVDENGLPSCCNLEVLEALDDPQLTLELNRYNLEYNVTPFELSQQAFFATEQELVQKTKAVNACAAEFGARAVPIGILPTITQQHFGFDFMTDRLRYKVLSDLLYKSRGDKFCIDIEGKESLSVQANDMTLEGANTSFQIHYRIDPREYADTYNAFQLVSPLVLALAGNSPTLFGHDLWHETRIPLFKQSIDTRHHKRYRWRQSARVKFGHGWVRKDAFELFTEAVRIYHPLLPICSDEDPLSVLAAGEIPALDELRLHQSTVWAWTRPIYDDAAGGHLRAELRCLPAGPTMIDMVANAAFYIGVAEGIKGHINELLPALPFELAEYNFHQSAQYGLDANIVWPFKAQSGCVETPMLELLEQAIPAAHLGLKSIGVGQAEIDYYLGVIKARVKSKQTGAVWQRKMLEHFEQTTNRKEALHLMLERYIANSTENRPVSQWEIN